MRTVRALREAAVITAGTKSLPCLLSASWSSTDARTVTRPRPGVPPVFPRPVHGRTREARGRYSGRTYSGRTPRGGRPVQDDGASEGGVPGRNFELALALTTTPGTGTVLRIEISDARGDRLPAIPASCAPDSQTGRGLTLIDHLADRWGTIPRHPNAKTVWAEPDLPRADAA